MAGRRRPAEGPSDSSLVSQQPEPPQRTVAPTEPDLTRRLKAAQDTIDELRASATAAATTASLEQELRAEDAPSARRPEARRGALAIVMSGSPVEEDGEPMYALRTLQDRLKVVRSSFAEARELAAQAERS